VLKSIAVFVSAVFASGFTLVMLGGSSGAEADRCMERPGSSAPAGRHWYYTLDHDTHRKCWVLAPEGLKPRSNHSFSDRVVPSRKAQIAFSSASSSIEGHDAVEAKPAKPTATQVEAHYEAAGLPQRPVEVPATMGSTGQGPVPVSDYLTEDIAMVLQEQSQTTKTTVADANIGAGPLTVGDANVTKDGTPLRAVLMLFAGTLLASGVARLAFMLAGNTPF
jgi:hypothetical protein